MKHREINSDEAIDRVLTGLRETAPLDGMQQRVLRGAEERASVLRRWTLQLPYVTTRSWVITAATIAVIVLASSWRLARSHRTIGEVAHAPSHLSSAQGPAEVAHLASAPIARPRLQRYPTRTSTREAAPVEPVSDEDALAISEMLAPSHPAPPMPLTEQERLLIRLIHKGDPVQMAMLDPGFRSLEEAKSKAEFDRFFAPKATSGSKSSTTLNQPATEESPATANQPAAGEKSDPKKQ